VREELVEQLSALAQLLTTTRLGAMAISLLGQAQHDVELAKALRDGWLEPRRAVGREVLQRAIDRGELRPDLDLDGALDGLYGPLYHRVLFGHGSVERSALQALVDQALRGLAVTDPQTHAARWTADAGR
jgi:Tetracyclin repressor-like, C-terminal domain